MGKRGPQPWVPTEAERKAVQTYASTGATWVQIGHIMGRSTQTLQSHCREDFDKGRATAHAQVGGKLFQMAMKGNIAALIFYAKAQMGWRETSRHEHTGKDGKAIDFRNLEGLTDEELEFLERISDKLAEQGGASSGEGEAE